MHPARPTCPPQHPDGQVGTHHTARKAGWSDGCGKGALTLTVLQGVGAWCLPLAATHTWVCGHRDCGHRDFRHSSGDRQDLGPLASAYFPRWLTLLGASTLSIPTLTKPVPLQPPLARGCHVAMGAQRKLAWS